MINLLERRELPDETTGAARMPRARTRKAVAAISCQGIAAEHVRMHREG